MPVPPPRRGLLRAVLALFRGSDRAAGGLARVATTLGQIALVCLGAHLAADHLDDQFLGGLSAAQAWLDATLAGPMLRFSEAVGARYETLLFWDELPLASMAAWAALIVELIACALLSASFLLTPRQARPSWAAWRRALSVHALVLPLALSGVLLAGAWSMSMAVEDLLPSAAWASVIAWTVAAAVGLRFGLPAWLRAVATLERSGKPLRDLAVAICILPLGLLAWVHGVPLWGWLP
ncbi:MAG: hypothetical protein ABIO70_26985 [Pseudomonadota bacterium]